MKSTSNIALILFYLAVVFTFQNCSNLAARQYTKALKQQSLGFNDNAISLFKKALENGGSRSKLNYLIAENYRSTNRIQEASHFYAEAIKAKSKEDKLGFYYAQSLKAIGSYSEAKIAFEKYAKVGLNSNLKKLAAKEANFLGDIHGLINKETYYNVKNAGNFINTEGPEYSPTLSKEGDIIFTASNRNSEYKATGQGFTDLYVVKPDTNLEDASSKRPFEPIVNKKLTHEACQAISPDGTMVIFVRSNDGKRKGGIDTDLYFIEMRDAEWTKPELLPFSDPRAWESTPSFSPDGKTLFFSSNKRGGYGGIDLYKVYLTDSGWTKPMNLGDQINTPGNEMFPTMRKDNVFFFASNGHPGLGGLDLFVLSGDSTVLDSTRIEEGVVNLGPPINTSADDFGIVYRDDLKGGYFSSNRAGGKGDDDIYEFWLGAKPKKAVKKEILSFLEIKVSFLGGEKNEQLTLDSTIVALVLESGEAYKDSITNANGILNLPIDTNASFTINIRKKGYFSNNVVFNTKSSTYNEKIVTSELTHRFYHAGLFLDKIEVGKEIVLKNIFYDFNKANIRPEAEPDLYLLIDFLKNNPEVEIELGSHTDSRGNDNYNIRLSQARAQSAVNFITSNEISANRIKAIGYGETKHIIEDAITEEEHQQNRRTEFKIVKLN